MKTLLFILIPFLTFGQEIKATLQLSNGQFINNAPDGRDWYGWDVASVHFYDSYSDTIFVEGNDLTRITYYGHWKHDDTGCYCSFSNQANDSIVFIFTDAAKFQWRGALMDHHGIAAIHFDNKYLGEVDTYNSRNLSHSRNWKAEGLDPKKIYKFKLVVTGRKNKASLGTKIVNHGFRIIK